MTIWPTVVWPRAELESFKAFLFYLSKVESQSVIVPCAPIEQGTRGHPDLHAEVHHAEEVRMVCERVDRRAHDHPGGVEVRFQLAHTAARSEVLNQPSWGDGQGKK